jgi:hypothetical protein
MDKPKPIDEVLDKLDTITRRVDWLAHQKSDEQSQDDFLKPRVPESYLRARRATKLTTPSIGIIGDWEKLVKAGIMRRSALDKFKYYLGKAKQPVTDDDEEIEN